MKTTNAIFKTIRAAAFAGVLLYASLTTLPASAQDITTGLVAHWEMNETSGTTLSDSSATGINGTMQNGLDGTSTITGVVGSALDFAGPGSNEIIDVPNNVAHNVDTFTLSMWLKTTQTCGNVSQFNCPGIIRKIAGNPPGSSNLGWYIASERNGGRVAFNWQDGTNVDRLASGQDIGDDAWHHIAIVKTATDIHIYVDGTINATEPFSGGSIINTENIVLGNGVSGGTGRSYDGGMDDVRYYNRALSEMDIGALYMNSGQNIQYPGYFVMVGNQPTSTEANEFDGDLGGLEGANATCMNYLNNYDWLGKSTAQAGGYLTPNNVRAWLCDDTTCQNMRGNTEYNFAKTEAGEENSGGGTFTTDNYGYFPIPISDSWDDNPEFNRNTRFWTGRAANNTPSGNSCNNWSDGSAGSNGDAGQTTATDEGLWSGDNDTCDTTDQFVCFVNPIQPHTLCNSAHAGKIIFNQDVSTMQYCDGAAWQSMGKESSLIHGTKTRGEDYAINAVEFDGATSLGANLASAWPGGHQLTGSMWIRNHNIVPTSQIFQPYDNADDGCRFQTIGDNIQCIFENDLGAEIINFTSNTSIAADTWYHVLFSFDTNSASNRHLYINGVADAATWTTYTVGQPLDDKVFGDRTIGGRNSGTSLMWDGDMADIWLNNTYIDLSVLANREKFIRDGNAVNLGTDGSRPTGSAPDIFLSGDTATWHTNKGTGGGFTENGALTDAATTPPATYEKKLIGWWKLDETNGTTAEDNTGNGYTGTMNGSLTGGDSIQAPVGTGLTFNGTDSYIQTGLNTDFEKGNYTLSAWVKTTDSGSQRVINTVDSGTNAKWLMVRNGNEVQCGLYQSDDAGRARTVTSADITNGEWHHIACTVDNAEITVYIDGVADATTVAHSNSLNTTSSNWEIGRNPSGFAYFNGNIDDVRVYNYALSAAEVTELYNSSSQILSYIPNAVNLAGEPSQRVRNNCCSGADGASFTGSMWIRFTDWPGDDQYILDSNGENRIFFTSGGDMFFFFRSPALADRVVLTADTNLDGDYGWHHIIYSFDVTNPANSYVYMDDVAVTLDNTTTNGTINFNTTNFTVLGQRNGNANLPHADIADFWFDYNTFIDLSVEANRRDFIDANGYPVDLGADGSTPTGSAPTIFLTSNAANIGVNSGSGNDFTIVDGTFTDVPGPSGDGKVPRYCANPTLPAGTLIFNTDEDVMQYCDGYQYIPLGPQGDGGSSCSNPSGVAGSLIFNTDFNTLQYCEGDEWVGIGNDPTVSVLAQGLIGHWRLDETGGTTVAVDSSGNGHDGTMQNGLTGADTAAGAVGSALTFDDTDDSIDVPSSPDFALRNFTLSSWVYIPSTVSAGWKAAIAHNRSGNNWYFLGKNNSDNRMHFRWSNSDTMNSNAALTSDTWNLVTATYDYTTNTANIYVNGVLDNTESSGSVQPTAVSDILRIGRNTNDTETWDGRLDDVRVYGRALSASEILQLYQTTGNIASTSIGLVAHYKLDETSGTELIDSSGNGYHMALNGGMNLASNTNIGTIDRAMGFHNGEYGSITNNADYDIENTSESLSWGGWFKKDNMNSSQMFSHTTGSDGYHLRLEGATPHRARCFADQNAGGAIFTGFVAGANDNQWHHAMCVWDRGDNRFKLYYDGVLIDAPGTDISAIGDITSTGDLLIAGNYPNDVDYDDLRIYDRALTTAEVSDIYSFADCPNVGDTCNDGSIYAGLSPDGDVKMYTTTSDAGIMAWNSPSTNYTTTGVTDGYDGDGNTASLITIDSDSVTPGRQDHNSAQYCADLITNGNSDWYLPALAEVSVLYDNLVDQDGDSTPGGPLSGTYNFDTSGVFYASSTEATSSLARYVRFDDGVSVGTGAKNNSRPFRCVRKD